MVAIIKALLIFGLLLLGGCADALRELKDDPAIVAISGTWFRIGLSPSPAAGGIPLPSIELGRGVIVRAGGDREIRIKVGERAELPSMTLVPERNVLQTSEDKLGSETSLEIQAGRPRLRATNKNEISTSVP